MTDGELVQRTNRRLDVVGFGANGVGATLLFVFETVLLPRTVPSDDYGRLLLRTVVAFAIVMVVLMPLGRALTVRGFWPAVEWLQAGRPAAPRDRERVLRYPLHFARTSATMWAIGGTAMGLVNLTVAVAPAAAIAAISYLGGATTAALVMILSERVMRPITARALAGGAPPPGTTPGVATRLTAAWTLATAVPLLGALIVVVADLAGASDPAGATLFLLVTALAVGLLAIQVVTRSVADSVGGVGAALTRIERGELDARVAVDDGSEVGQLQAGFNRMATGLEERERLREAFGTFVDPELAERVLREGTDLAGEEVDVSVLFLDVRGFTTLAERASAREVVARLNALYDRVVPVVLRNGGHANKFIGDGMLAVFGAPERHADHADRAVAAALEIARVADGDLRIGVGVNSGRVLVGTVGGGGRLDFTVIGDPVNTAARVESATRQTGDDVLITEETRRRLRSEHGDWEPRPAIPLKGKSEPVALYAPRKAS
jgi:adenylate cyclase